MDNNKNENMPDLGEVLSKLTSNPEMMQQISKLAESFKSSSPPTPDIDDDNDYEAIETMARRPGLRTQHPPKLPHPDNKKPKNPHFNVDQHTHLFKALKPYLNAERRETLEYIMQLFNIIKLLEMSGINLGNLIPAFNTTSADSNTNELSEE